MLFVWVKIPCDDGFGSCTFDDFCARMPNPCPAVFKQKGICTCPIGKGSYDVPISPVLYISSINPLIDWLESGNYWIEARIKDHLGNELLCIDVNLSLSLPDLSYKNKLSAVSRI